MMQSRAIWLPFAGLLMLGLAGCEIEPVVGEPVSTIPAATPKVPAASSDVIADEGVATDATILASIPAVPKTPEPPKPAPPLPQLQPASLVGLTAKGLLVEIGEADFVRLEGHMQIWQYKTATCVVDFFLYPASQITDTSAYLVTDWYSRARNFDAQLDVKTCREELAAKQTF